MNCIELKNISFSYGRTKVLQNISFTITCGDYVGIVGPNGSGKTTLLKIILGLEKPDFGSVSFFGHDPTNCRCQHKIGYVPQRAAHVDFPFPATIEEFVKSGRVAKIGFFKNFSQKDLHAVANALQLVGIADIKDKKIGELSGGQRQRVFIARALAGEPKIFILDEPTTAIDTTSKDSLYKLLTKFNKELGITIIFVSHDIDVVSREARTVLYLNQTLVSI